MTLVKFNSKTRNSAPYFNNIFDSLFNEGLNNHYGMSKTPGVNIVEDALMYTIQLAAPGLVKEDFQLTVKKGTLSVWVEKKNDEQMEQPAYTRREFDFSSFARSFNLPEGVDAENITAEYLNGILSIRIAKVDEKTLSKEIKVS